MVVRVLMLVGFVLINVAGLWWFGQCWSGHGVVQLTHSLTHRIPVEEAVLQELIQSALHPHFDNWTWVQAVS